MHTTDQKFRTTLNCFSKFIIKANFAIDHKVISFFPKFNLCYFHFFFYFSKTFFVSDIWITYALNKKLNQC